MHKVGALGTADDLADADGATVLNWKQAQAAGRAWAAKQTSTGPLTVAQAVADYIPDLRAKSDEAGRGFRFEAGHEFRPEVGHNSDLKPATVPI